jgi:hypothetical protein
MLSMVEGCFFGEIEVLDNCNRIYYTLAEQPCQIYFCKSAVFLETINKYSLIKAEILEIVKRRKEKYSLCKFLGNEENEENKQRKNIPKDKLWRSNQYYLNMLI